MSDMVATGAPSMSVTVPLYTRALVGTEPVTQAPDYEYRPTSTAGLQKGLFANVMVVGIAGTPDQPVPAALSKSQPATHSVPDAGHGPGIAPQNGTGFFQVDTGSWATVVAQSLVEQVVGKVDFSKYPQYQPGSLEYSSDGTVESGVWVPLTLAFPDARLPDGTVPTTTVTALVRTDGGEAFMLGIGFNTSFATNVKGETLTSANNAALNLQAMKDGDMAHSYMIDRGGLHLGWQVDEHGKDWTVQQLDPTGIPQPTDSPPDWLSPTGTLTIDGHVHKDASLLFDTGTPDAFVHYAGVGPGHLLPSGRDFTVSVPGERGHTMSYGFVTGDGGSETPLTVWESPATHGATNFMNTGANFFRDHKYVYDADKGQIGFKAYDAATASPTMAQEVSYLNGLRPDGTLTDDSYAGWEGKTAHKWHSSVAGTGATITYGFDPESNFTATEQATVERAMAVWESVADVRFVAAGSSAAADVLIHRGDDGKAHTSDPSSLGSGHTLGTFQSQVVVSIDTSKHGFDLSGSLEEAAGHGFGTITHELGHALGLGHAGPYNGDVDPKTDQFSAYDDKMWAVMSYIKWTQDGEAKYGDQYPVPNTDWGSADGEDRTVGQTVMQLDIQAIQQLYGKPSDGNTPFSGGQTYGFNSNISGPLETLYDFSINTQPVLTLYNQGSGNTLDLSGFAQSANVDLRAGAFSSAGGMVNNIAIAQGTLIETAIGGDGADTMTGNAAANTLDGGDGTDRMYGLQGNDTYLVDAAQDQVFEVVQEGFDHVRAEVSYALGAGQSIELLTTADDAGTATLALVGNEIAQTLRGDAGANALDGRGGADQLVGLGGADIFAFSTALGSGNVDRIVDFAHEDTIWLAKDIFTALDTGTLSASAFKNLNIAGAKVDADDRILYDHKGRLFYDADGAGGDSAVVFAKLSYKPMLTHDDFLVA